MLFLINLVFTINFFQTRQKILRVLTLLASDAASEGKITNPTWIEVVQCMRESVSNLDFEELGGYIGTFRPHLTVIENQLAPVECIHFAVWETEFYVNRGEFNMSAISSKSFSITTEMPARKKCFSTFFEAK